MYPTCTFKLIYKYILEKKYFDTPCRNARPNFIYFIFDINHLKPPLIYVQEQNFFNV